MKNINKGFTLIELLVVVAIIGILASVVLASLNNARGKGSDAAVKSDLKSAISQGEIFYSTNTSNLNTYTGICATGVVGGARAVGDFVVAAAKAGGISTTINGNGVAGAYNLATCHDSASAWVAEVPLSTSTSVAPKTWCVDNLGKSQQNTTVLAAGATNC